MQLQPAAAMTRRMFGGWRIKRRMDNPYRINRV
jgi:hypothetical protein